MSSAAVIPGLTERVSTRPEYVFSGQTATLSSGGTLDKVPLHTRDLYRADSSAANRTDEFIKATPHFKQFLALLISDVAQVRSVRMHQEKKLLRIFIVVDEFDFDVNEKIYDREEHIMEVFAGFDFDFHITSQPTVSDPGLDTVWAR